MKYTKQTLFLFLSIGAVFLLCAGEVIDEIIAVVNDDFISLTEYRGRYQEYQQLLRSQFQGEDLEKQQSRLKSELLEMMITDLLLLQVAREKKLNVSDQLKMYIENLKKENNIESDEELLREMQRQGVDYEVWRKQMEENIMRQAVVVSEVDRSIVLDDSEIVNYYKLHPEEFTVPDEYKLRGIYLSSEDQPEDEVEKKKNELSAKLKAGEDFASLAGSYSEGPGKESQGDLGTFKKGELEKSLAQGVENLKAGDVSAWIKVKNGWYLLKLEEKKQSYRRTFEEARDDIEQKIFAEKKAKKLEEFLTKLKGRSYIKILKPNHAELLG
jgi:parvulin-like peptidyl-prolyl isomerase